MNYALLLCGGSGKRMGSLPVGKTLMPVGGIPAVVRCARAFSSADCRLILVVPQGQESLYHDVLDHFGLSARITAGGKERQDSVGRGLALVPEDGDLVLIHDGARPLVSEKLIRELIRQALISGSAVPALPVTDTLKRADADGTVLGTTDRAGLYRVQTPQVFCAGDLRKARAAAGEGPFTDDAQVMEQAGFKVHLCPGEANNLKLTYPEDFVMAEKLLSPLFRTGFGLDAHRLTAGRDLVLCGVRVPYDKGLDGHSDADVALHALTDALLGACALGDIGTWFPDTCEEYRGISSRILLERAAALVRDKGFEIVSCDITIVCQKPKLAPYIGQMREYTAESLGLDTDRVSVKATTTEGMGYEGRGEGISAHACATVSAPWGKQDQATPASQTL